MASSKRKFTAFPAATHCPMVPPSPLPQPLALPPHPPGEQLCERNKEHPYKPTEHSWTRLLVSQVSDFKKQLPSFVQSVEVKAKGIIEMIIKAGGATSSKGGEEEGYGGQPWLVMIGGHSFEEGDFPVCIRFRDPITMLGVDDTGIIHGEPFISQPFSDDFSLKWVSARLAALFRGELHSPFPDWATQFSKHEELCRKKLEVIRSYLPMALRGDMFVPAHPQPQTQIRPEWLASKVRALLGGSGESPRPEDWQGLATEVSPGIFTFDLFTDEFCEVLLAELENFEKSPLPRRRPNTMNNYGLVVNEIGLLSLMNELLEILINPISSALFPSEIFCQMGGGLDNHHSFVVQYRASNCGPGDEGLDMHHDSSEVTLNVCLGRGKNPDYKGLAFCGRGGQSDVRKHQHSLIQHRGEAVLHLGNHRHGAGRMLNGERWNLIIWARNSTFRLAASSGIVLPDGYPKAKEDLSTLDRVCLSAANDADFQKRLHDFSGE